MWNRIKQNTKSFLPPIFLHLYGLFFLSQSSYFGLYKSFSECINKNSKITDYNNENYAKWSKTKTDNYLNIPIYKRTTWYMQDLKLLVYTKSLIDRLGNIRIFDFGGGVGWHYIKLLNLKEFPKIQYTVYDVPKIVSIGKEYFNNKNFKNIEFTDSLPTNYEFDMCILSSVLHYVENYKALLSKICSYKPKFLFISRVPAGDLDEFVTLQITNEFSLPCYVFNWGNLKNILSDLNYFTYNEWDEAETFYLKTNGKKIKLNTYKGAVFISK